MEKMNVVKGSICMHKLAPHAILLEEKIASGHMVYGVMRP